MITIEDEVRGILDEVASSAGVSLIRGAGYSNSYTVMAVDPASRQCVAVVSVDTGSPHWNSIHYWINVKSRVIGARAGDPYCDGGQFAKIGDAESMRDLRNHLRAAFLMGRKVYLPASFPEFPVAGHPARVVDRDGDDLVLHLSRLQNDKYVFVDPDGDDMMLWPRRDVDMLKAATS